METIYRTCNLCEAQCGLAFEREGDAIVAVHGDDADVLSHGYVCPKGIANRELHHDPDRLRTPLRRTASGDFEPIGWDEALGLAAERLGAVRARFGGDAVALYFGNPIVHNPGALIARTGITRALGTRNSYSAGSQDTSPRFAASYLLYGASFVIPIPDLERTDYLLCLGANPLVSNGSFLTAPDMRGRLRALRARGGRLVVVDPRRSETAREADEHVSILPGGDAALLLGMVRVLLDEGRVDRRAASRVARGFGEIERALREAGSMGRFADACGVDEATIARLAREFADARTSAAYSRIGICNNRFGTLATYATDLLNLAAGRLGAAGGALFPRPALDVNRILMTPGMDGYARWRSRVRGLPETLGDLPSACLAEEIETPGPGQVRALVCYAGNPVLSTPNGRRLERALAGLDFMVAIDFYVTETTRHADLVLPPASSLSEEHLDVLFPSVMIRNVARFSPAVVEKKPGECHDWEILRALAERLGGGLFGMRPLDAALRALRRIGVEVTPMKMLALLLRTGRSGDRFLPFSRGVSLAKLRRAPHGIDLGAHPEGVRVQGLRRRARFDAPPLLAALRAFLAELPRSAQPGELLLVGRRQVRGNNSWLHNLPSLASGKERCVLLVHPEDAKAAGVRNGELARLESRVHAGLVPVQTSDEMRPGVVSLPHGFGHGAVGRFQRTAGQRPGVSVNDFTDENDVESVVGQSILNGVPVRLSRAS